MGFIPKQISQSFTAVPVLNTVLHKVGIPQSLKKFHKDMQILEFLIYRQMLSANC